MNKRRKKGIDPFEWLLIITTIISGGILVMLLKYPYHG